MSLSLSCSGQFTLSDASLKTDTAKISNVCECNDAIILIVKEDITILTEVKRVGKQSPKIKYLDDEYKKRIDKFNEIYKHCFPLYQQPGGDYKCANRTEAEKLDKELSSLKKDLDME